MSTAAQVAHILSFVTGAAGAAMVGYGINRRGSWAGYMIGAFTLAVSEVVFALTLTEGWSGAATS